MLNLAINIIKPELKKAVPKLLKKYEHLKNVPNIEWQKITVRNACIPKVIFNFENPEHIKKLNTSFKEDIAKLSGKEKEAFLKKLNDICKALEKLEWDIKTDVNSILNF